MPVISQLMIDPLDTTFFQFNNTPFISYMFYRIGCVIFDVVRNKTAMTQQNGLNMKLVYRAALHATSNEDNYFIYID